MNKFWTVLSHTYMTRLKSKAFIITTLIVLLFIVALANLPSIIDTFTGKDGADQIAVIDESNELLEVLSESVAELDESIDLIPFKGTEEEGKEAVREEEFSGFLVLYLDEQKLPAATYYENSAVSSWLEMMIQQQLQQIKVETAMKQAGVDEVTFAAIQEDVTFEKIALDEAAKTDEELDQTRGIVYIMLFVLYMAVVVYGQMIATDVATEKSSRVMEILISSASPVTHMFAKIIGIALLGLTQIVLIFIVGYNLILTKSQEFTGDFFEVFGFDTISLNIYFYAILFFILGYLLYATIAAMLGSLVSRVEDVQYLLMPMIFLVMIAFFIAIFGLGMPEAKFITITSFIPFFSPMIMFLRVGMLDVPVWQVITSIGLLVMTIVLLAILGARIYKGGVLMYGASRSLKDFKKAFMLSKKN
ncbi:ABC transporter permease [Pseudogracilibacillus sp. SE30717A]|uniref:ABC transporter permease n=1 Tax=Pseudogracilibacillus sp. SE30717A TaxID=3098293 RepID=UPI00300E2309